MAFEDKTITDVKNYWNSRPCNIRHSPREVGTKEYFDEVEHRKYFVEPHIPEFAEFDKWNGMKVLEIGCGIGTDTINFARHGAQVTSVDLSEESIAVAKKRVETYGFSNRVNFFNGNAEQLTQFVPKDLYDLIYSFGVIHHTPNPENVLNEIRSYSKPGTTVKIMVYNRHSWKVLWIILKYGKGQFWKLDELVAKYSEAQTGCPVTYSYSKKQFSVIMEKYGFKVRDAFVEHIFPYSIPEYVKYEYVKVWYFRWIPNKMFRWFEHHFGWHLCVSAQYQG